MDEDLVKMVTTQRKRNDLILILCSLLLCCCDVFHCELEDQFCSKPLNGLGPLERANEFLKDHVDRERLEYLNNDVVVQDEHVPGYVHEQFYRMLSAPLQSQCQVLQPCLNLSYSVEAATSNMFIQLGLV